MRFGDQLENRVRPDGKSETYRASAWLSQVQGVGSSEKSELPGILECDGLTALCFGFSARIFGSESGSSRRALRIRH